MSRTACVILAAGLGTRMKSRLPKVLHPVCGLPMIAHVVRAVGGLRPERTIMVTGPRGGDIRDAAAAAGLRFAVQKKPRGTGDALRAALPALEGFRGTVLVVNGDTPLIDRATIRAFASRHRRDGNAVSVLSFEARDPSGYGRIVRDASGAATAIVEEKDADAGQKNIREVNSGVYAIDHRALGLVTGIPLNRAKGEYYLTDIVAFACRRGLRTAAYNLGHEEDFLGVNTREELSRASAIMRKRLVRRWTERGVQFLAPDTVFIHPDAVIAAEAAIYPNVLIEGASRIGKGAVVYPHVRISGSVVGERAVIRDSSVLEGAVVKARASVGPFAHLRPGSVVGPDARIGNFVELKKTAVGAGSKASHLSYLGDARIGRNVNIGAGTITCNYDGRSKHLTVIGDGVFVGSDTQFVAPVTVGRGAYVGAGSTITKDVPPDALALSRTAQKTLPGWAAKRRVKPARRKPDSGKES
ncbi:MAG: bifunctional UDP-N-acetylglucosamine diphosphorylase/glucosamine-1-phosphate N-acetyltransferase GlmU [Thermodesulfovibrionales bacterium]